jgi:hypothetical protein
VDGWGSAAARATGWWVGGGDRGDRLLDLGSELVDLAGKRVDLVQQHPGEEGVVVGELAGEGLHQRGALDAQPPAGQFGQHLRVALPGDQRLQHGPARDAEPVGTCRSPHSTA